MFTEIQHAILPLALRTGGNGDELERAALPTQSLARHWVDRRPLQLVIVSPERDVDTIKLGLATFPTLTWAVTQ